MSTDDPGGGKIILNTIANSLQKMERNQTSFPSKFKDCFSSEMSDADNKYLHKKFKKVASAISIKEQTALQDHASKRLLDRGDENVFMNGKVTASSHIRRVSDAVCTNIQVKSKVEADYNKKKMDINAEVIDTHPNDSALCHSVSNISQSITAQPLGRYMCPYCKLACAKPSILQKHIRAHTNERPYPCRPCGLAFNTKSNLYKHCRSRAHALKFEGEEEVGSDYNVCHRFICSLMDSSDIEDEDDIAISNSTPPPSCSAASLPVSSTLSNNVSFTPFSSRETNSSQEFSKEIYKPKFHKAALYCKEEEKEMEQFCKRKKPGFHFITLKAPSSSPPCTPQKLCMSEAQVTSHSTFSEYLRSGVNVPVSASEVNVDLNNSTRNEMFLQDYSAELGRKASISLPSSTFSVVPRHYLSSPRIAVSNYPMVSATSIETNKHSMHCTAQQPAQSGYALPKLRTIEDGSPFLSIGCPSIFSEESTFVNCSQPLNLSTTHEEAKTVGLSSDYTAMYNRKRSHSEEFSSSLKALEHHVLSNQETSKKLNICCKSNDKVTKLEKIQHVTTYGDNIETVSRKVYCASQSTEDSVMRGIVLKTQAAQAAGDLTSCSGVHPKTGVHPRISTAKSMVSHLAAFASNESYFACTHCSVGFKTSDALAMHQCISFREQKECGSNDQSSWDSLNQVGNYSSQNKPIFSHNFERMNDSVSLTLENVSLTEIRPGQPSCTSQVPNKNHSVAFHLNDNSKSTTLALPSFPSPGTLLGHTPLVHSIYIHQKNNDNNTNTVEFEEQHRRTYFPKRRCLDSDISSRETNSATSSPEIRSPLMTPGPAVFNASGPVSTLKSLEELSKCPLRPNSLQMFGGEVQIVNGSGETKTMRIEPSLRGNKSFISSASEADLTFKIENHFNSSSLLHTTRVNNEKGSDTTGITSPHIVVTIAKCGLNSGGTIVQIPQKSASFVSTSMPSGNVVKPHEPGSGDTSVRAQSSRSKTPSPLHKSFQRNNVRFSGVENTSPSLQHSYATDVASSTTVTNTSYLDTTKLLAPIVPNISTPNLAVPGIPVPTFEHNLPLMPFTSFRGNAPIVNPLNDITAYNPLTLQAHTSLFCSVPYSVHSFSTNRTDRENTTQVHATSFSIIPEETVVSPYSSRAFTILHGGKHIPHVPDMPGPQILQSNLRLKMLARKETSKELLNLASPSREATCDTFVSTYQRKNCKYQISKSTHALIGNTVVLDSLYMEQLKHCSGNNIAGVSQKSNTQLQTKLPAYSKPLPDKLTPTFKNETQSSVLYSSKFESYPSTWLPGSSEDVTSTQMLDITNGVPVMVLDSAKTMSEVHRIPKCAPLYHNECCEMEEDSSNKNYALCSAGEKDKNKSEVRSESIKTDKNTIVAAKFRRPTSLPLKPDTCVPEKTLSCSLTPVGIVPLNSPETPRHKKSYAQYYLNGYVFTFLTLKISTKPFFCILTRTQPMYAIQSPENPKLYMYSNWKTSPVQCRATFAYCVGVEWLVSLHYLLDIQHPETQLLYWPHSCAVFLCIFTRSYGQPTIEVWLPAFFVFLYFAIYCLWAKCTSSDLL